MADGAGRRGGRCVPERTGANDAVGRMNGRADGAERPRMVERTGAERVRTVERRGRRGPRGADMRTGERGVDEAQHARTGGRADERTRGRADGRTGRSGPALRGRRVE